ncbi:MAG: response regulator transcription factor, partial [Microthrixaceae bacterium]|nr:response regulator transcription factor [Microthrixaceae bacterium]
RELVARIRAVLRRAGAAGGGGAGGGEGADHPITWGPLSVDRRTRLVRLEGAEVALTPKEYDLLVELCSDPGAVLTREHLIDRVWDENWWGSTKTLDVHVASLRKKLRPELIETVRGVGYRLAEVAGGP